MSRNREAPEWQERVLERLLSLKRDAESDAAFARRLGLQPQHLSNYRSGRHGLSIRTALRIARNTGLSLDWLLRGEGRPFRGGADGPEGRHPDGREESPVPIDEVKEHSAALLRKLDELRRGGRIPDERVDRVEKSLDELLEPLTL